MKNDDINTYITRFAELAHKALYQENDPAVLEIFKRGLPFKLLDNCMNYDQPATWEAWKAATRKRQAVMAAVVPSEVRVAKEHQPKLRHIIPPPTI